MSAVRLRAYGTVGISGFRTGGLWAAIMPSEAALFRLHKFIDDISPFALRRPATGGPGDRPEGDGEQHDSPWDDPALWMLMLH